MDLFGVRYPTPSSLIHTTRRLANTMAKRNRRKTNPSKRKVRKPALHGQSFSNSREYQSTIARFLEARKPIPFMKGGVDIGSNPVRSRK